MLARAAGRSAWRCGATRSPTGAAADLRFAPYEFSVARETSDALDPMIPKDMCVKLNALDATRAVEQTALLMALTSKFGRGEGFSAHRRTRTDKGEPLAADAMFGYLGHMFCSGRLLCPDPVAAKGQWQKAWDALHRTNDGEFGEAPRGGATDWRLDFIAAPIDGARAFFAGMNEGTITALAGGSRGAFADDLNETSSHYLVITAARKVLSDLEGVAATIYRECVERGEIRNKHDVEEVIVKPLCAAAERRVLTMATAVTEQGFGRSALVPALQQRGRVRAFNGSSIAAGLCPFFPSHGIDLFIGRTRRPHAAILAVGASVTDCEFVAIPLRSTDEGNLVSQQETDAASDVDGAENDSQSLRFDKTWELLKLDSVIKKKQDLFLVATGISETSLLRGVRILDEQLAAVHTLCLRSRSRSSRIVDHRQEWRRQLFRFLEPNKRLTSITDHFSKINRPLLVTYRDDKTRKAAE